MEYSPIYFNDDSYVVILTGAGISAESGIPTFRDSGGLLENHSIEDVATPEGFARNPELVNRFYNQYRASLSSCIPNAGHVAIAELQKRLRGRCFLVTQNVDDLHERAGSTQVLHMHGSLFQIRCLENPSHVMDWKEDIADAVRCPICDGKCRPHIVWFGENPIDTKRVEQKIRECTHFFSIGTSGNVYPAAGFKSVAMYHGAEIFHVNIDSDPCDWTMQVIGKSGDTLPQIFAEPPEYEDE